MELFRNITLTIGSFIFLLLFLYIAARLISAAIYRSKHDSETKGK